MKSQTVISNCGVIFKQSFSSLQVIRPKVQSAKRTCAWKGQPLWGQTTLGHTVPSWLMACLRSVNACPFGQVIVALKRLMVDGWHGAHCIGGGGLVLSAYLWMSSLRRL